MTVVHCTVVHFPAQHCYTRLKNKAQRYSPILHVHLFRLRSNRMVHGPSFSFFLPSLPSFRWSIIFIPSRCGLRGGIKCSTNWHYSRSVTSGELKVTKQPLSWTYHWTTATFCDLKFDCLIISSQDSQYRIKLCKVTTIWKMFSTVKLALVLTMFCVASAFTRYVKTAQQKSSLVVVNQVPLLWKSSQD